MDSNLVYKDIASRTGGDIYIGVVGPVRCGKSTFIKKFMEEAVIPGITDEYDKKRATDELPQSSGGKTVMTTEPKFIPDEAVTVSFGENALIKVKMIDCVGYMIPDALGATEDGNPRMVKTPWSDELMPFEVAAETGTTKVIRDHSTVGMLVTTDGTFGDIPRESYVEAEERVAKELKSIGKPFVIILNSAQPEREESETLAIELEKKYSAPVALINCMNIDFRDIGHILEMLLYEFPINELTVKMPTWLGALDSEHKLIRGITDAVLSQTGKVKNLSDASSFIYELRVAAEKLINDTFSSSGCSVYTDSVDIGSGNMSFNIDLPEEIYYKVLCEETGLQVGSQSELISVLKELAAAKSEFDKYAVAIEELEENGYGVVLPDIESMKLEEPQIIRQSGSYGVKLKASATSVHMIKATIQTEINPIVGTEEQSEELIHCLMEDFEGDTKRIWDSNIFGKSLYELLNDGLHTKLAHLSPDSKEKLSETLSRVINEGSGGLICIIL